MVLRGRTWDREQKLLAIAAVLALAIGATAVGTIDTADDVAEELASPRQAATPQPSGTTTPQPTATGSNSVSEAVLDVPGGGSSPGTPGRAAAPANCEAMPVDEVGVTDETIVIGQIVTDSNQIPQQLRPAQEGLQAFVNAVNAGGGYCGREISIEYRNDNLNPATHRNDYQDLADEVLAFVGNESLLDNLDYEQNPPYEPTTQGAGSFVPDIGGLAFSYNRSQSSWHAGVIGSVSPVLVGGGQFGYFTDRAAATGDACRRGGVVYLQEPTGASEDQARLGQVAVEADWGGGVGEGNSDLYSANLLDPVPAYEVLVDRMVSDGVNCVFTYTDLQSSINLAQAMQNRGVWPPAACGSGDDCFRVVYVPLSAYDARFIRDAGDASVGVSTFIPHLPLNEIGHPAMKAYLQALESVEGATPSTFSVIGYASGQMLLEALSKCPRAPTRACLIEGARSMENFTADGLLGGVTPFRSTRATFEGTTYDWKWIFNRTVALTVQDRDGLDFYRVNPDDGFFNDTLKVARGTPG